MAELDLLQLFQAGTLVFFPLKSINLIDSSFFLFRLTQYSACTLRTHIGFV